MAENVDLGPWQTLTEVHWTDTNLFAVIEVFQRFGNLEKHIIAGTPNGPDMMHQIKRPFVMPPGFLPNATDPHSGHTMNTDYPWAGGVAKELYVPPCVFPPTAAMINGIEGEEFAGYRGWAEDYASTEVYPDTQACFPTILNLKKITGTSRPEGIITFKVDFDTGNSAGTYKISLRLFTHTKFTKNGTYSEEWQVWTGHPWNGPFIVQQPGEPEPVFSTSVETSTWWEEVAQYPDNTCVITINVDAKTAYIPPILDE